jgi:hypothetical protein
MRFKITILVWCLFAFLGGIGLSRHYLESGDLFMLIGIHWIATFLNTPRYPGARFND